MKEYTVREVASLFGKHEETVKRWIRAGKFPNAYRNSHKEGWRIIESDLTDVSMPKIVVKAEDKPQISDESHEEAEEELVKLAYEAVTLTSPTEQMVNILAYVGIKRTLEILLIMQQSPNKVKNPEGFIRKAISKGWSPTSLPQRIDSKKASFERGRNRSENSNQEAPSFSWLEKPF
ncbi:helix-turn-helix domain-containing protein [Halalkalibacter akibai]|uniref:Helix-turn-helix domain-containing protein n=1 Tax=Halalkalibacter akibai (strain ATCC 43226 / DSM 21942 / CIP 109018 / JCM 9157 / 1139) TaxID=1236973 RepID=W4QXE9_HALA3|nr:helix-turn-helix domain-containing protein [Halalkalibacter akibai]GAE36318.1 hypothetical protein JCM9157_3479 [Halalkalibacter akibai JCM 9157]